MHAGTVHYTGPMQMYSKCKIFWKMPLKRNRVLESDSEREETEADKQWTDNRQS